MSVLLPLVVAVPLLGAVVPFVLGNAARVARTVTGLLLSVQVGLAVALVLAVGREGSLTYVVGALPAAVGIGLLADPVSSAFTLLVAVSAAAIFVTVRTEGTGAGDSLWLLLVAGLTGVTVTADVFNLYVFLEISGLAAYALVASGRGVDAALAAFRYLLVGTVGATLYLLGVGYLYVATESLSMVVVRDSLGTAGYDSPLVAAAFALVVVGLAVKLALFPLHTWKPTAYATSPVDVSALLATLVSTVAGYALVRLTFDVFTASFLTAVPVARTGLLVAGAVSVAAGGVLTFRATEIRRLLAYSSVLQFGLVVVAVGVATPAAVTGALLLLVGHAIAKGGLFAAVGVLGRTHGVTTVADYRGLVRDAPVFTVAIAAVFASLVGLPPTLGFAGKWYVALGALDGGSWAAAALVVASTLVSLLYVGRVVETMLFDLSSTTASGEATADGSAGPRATTDGGVETADRTAAAVDRRADVDRSNPKALALLLAAVGALVVLGLLSSDLAAWFAPVVEGWL